MNHANDRDAQSPQQKKLSRLIKLQVLVGILAVAITVAIAVAIPGLLYKKIALQNEVDKLEHQREELRKVLNAINPILGKYGVLKKLTVDNLNSGLVKQSFEANQTIQTILSKAYTERAKPIWYYSKDTNVDPEGVRDSLKQFGFLVIPKKAKRPDLPTNAIDFGAQVNLDQAKLVAYTLIRAGIEIKAIAKSSLQDRANVVQIFGDERLKPRPALTVEQIREQTQFINYPGPDVREWPEGK